jgi:hypothetical protein
MGRRLEGTGWPLIVLTWLQLHRRVAHRTVGDAELGNAGCID